MLNAPAVKTILIINIIIFSLWFFSMNGTQGLLFLPEGFMIENFLVSWQSLSEGRLWTLITAVFSHNLFLHLFLNMYVLYNFGHFLENLLGRREFICFYLGAGAFSSLCHAIVSATIMSRPDLSALGASGAISGLILLFSLIFPRQIILLFGLIPVKALVGALLFAGLDLWGLLVQAEGGGLPIGHGAHLGGALFGAGYYFFRVGPRLQKSYR
ncbi:MAG: Rhomboid protease GlpG [Pseudomonadota bacterium]|jgi:rhomboid-like protein